MFLGYLSQALFPPKIAKEKIEMAIQRCMIDLQASIYYMCTEEYGTVGTIRFVVFQEQKSY